VSPEYKELIGQAHAVLNRLMINSENSVWQMKTEWINERTDT
jgi:hypothetical protein